MTKTAWVYGRRRMRKTDLLQARRCRLCVYVCVCVCMRLCACACPCACVRGYREGWEGGRVGEGERERERAERGGAEGERQRQRQREKGEKKRGQ